MIYQEQKKRNKFNPMWLSSLTALRFRCHSVAESRATLLPLELLCNNNVAGGLPSSLNSEIGNRNLNRQNRNVVPVSRSTLYSPVCFPAPAFLVREAVFAARFPLFCFATSRKSYLKVRFATSFAGLVEPERSSSQPIQQSWSPVKRSTDNIVHLVNIIRRNISKHKLITCEEKLLITISGGQDSTCLLLILYILQNQISFHLNCIWINHFWQKSSFFTMSHVSKSCFCFSSSIKMFIPLKWEQRSLLSGTSFPKVRLVFSAGKKARSCRVLPERSLLLKRHILVTREAYMRPSTQINSNIKQIIESKKYSEQKARNWRHTATQRGASFYEYNGCTQGHTKSDRVETILFNLIRGTGISGICALQWRKKQKLFLINKNYPIFFNFLEQTHFYGSKK